MMLFKLKPIPIPVPLYCFLICNFFTKNIIFSKAQRKLIHC